MADEIEEGFLNDEDFDEEIEESNQDGIDVGIVTGDCSYTASQLSDMINKNQLIPNPDYQRDFIYNQEKQSKIIESILLEVPIPSVYLAQVDKNRYEVIDGQQRIISIVNFYNNAY